MIDLQQISIALNLATRRSLLVIDEFGKGTESSGSSSLRPLIGFVVLTKIQTALVSLVACSSTY